MCFHTGTIVEYLNMSSKAVLSGSLSENCEWSIFETPSYKRKELEQIFQGIKFEEKTVHTTHLWQKSENSMSSWYEASDNERTKLGERVNQLLFVTLTVHNFCNKSL